MKLKSGFIYRLIAGQHVVVPVGASIVDFNGIITLNETAAFLWNVLREGKEKGDLVAALVNEYDVTEEQAVEDVEEFIRYLEEHKVVEND